MECTLGQGAGFSLTARRNNSITSSARLLAYGLPAAVSLVIAIAFALLGAWMVFPFAGIEIAILLWALCQSERHALDFERLTISDDRVTIEVVDGGSAHRFEMNRWWAQVVCAPDGARLALRSHGREVSFGRFWDEGQRSKVAGELRMLLRTA